MYRLWPPEKAVDARIVIPGSKSYSNRALILAALAAGDSSLIGISPSEDSGLLCAALERVGVVFSAKGNVLQVAKPGAGLAAAQGTIDLGAAGTSMRFFTALCASIPGTDCVLCGSERMHQRPIAELVDALTSLGARIEYKGKTGCPPLHIRGASLRGGNVRMSGSESSQFLSALLLIAPRLSSALELETPSAPVSESYLEMTVETLAAFGVTVTWNEIPGGGRRYHCSAGQQPAGCEYIVQGDASGASYFLGMAAISGGRIVVENVSVDSAQGDAQFVRLLERMGCAIESGANGKIPWIGAAGPSKLRAINAGMLLMPDTAQTLAVVAAFAEGQTEITGLQTLVHKETDRLSALCAELAQVGISAQAGSDRLTVRGGTPRAGRIRTYEDHRMAMSFAQLAVRVPGIEIEHPEVVRKSFPEFWQKLETIGVQIEKL